MWICRNADLQKSRFAEMQIYRNADMQKCRFCRNADLQKCRFAKNAELQMCRKWGSLRVDCTTSEMQVRVADL